MDWITIFIKGFSTGLGMSLMLGTVFFAIIQNALTHGVRSGIMIATGVVVSDIIFIYLAIQSMHFALFLDNYTMEVKWVGAILLALFGMAQFFRTPHSQSWESGLNKKPAGGVNVYKFAATGFFLNVINPVNFFIWLSLSSLLGVGLGYDTAQKITFFTGSLLSILLTESLLAVFASRLKKYLNNKALQWVSRISGAIFLTLALYLILA